MPEQYASPNGLAVDAPYVMTQAGNLAMGAVGTVDNRRVVVVKKASGAATQVTLSPSPDIGWMCIVKDGKGDAATNNITVVGASAATIDGASSFIIAQNYGGAIFHWSGTEWNVLVNFQGLTNAQLNLLAAITASAAEINRVAQASTRVVTTTAATLAITAALHGERIVNLNSTHTQTITLPQATGSGDVYTFVVGTTGTDGSKIIAVANSTDILQGIAQVANTQNTTDSFLTSVTSDTVTLNNTTTGGVIGTEVVIKDIATGVFLVRVNSGTTGNPATPFSAAVP